MKILAVIPAHNEEDCLEETLKSLTSCCPDVDYLVVDDGSTDSTRLICDKHRFSFVSLPINTKLTSAFRTGMKYAHRNNYDCVVQFDADGQHLPEYIPLMAAAMEQNSADIVIASRCANGSKLPGPRGMGSRLISRLIRVTTGVKITDPTSGMRMYNKEMIAHFAQDFDIAPEPDTIALYARKGKTIVEIPAEMQDRQGGESYFDLPHIAAYMLRTLASIILFQWFR